MSRLHNASSNPEKKKLNVEKVHILAGTPSGISSSQFLYVMKNGVYRHMLYWDGRLPIAIRKFKIILLHGNRFSLRSLRMLVLGTPYRKFASSRHTFWRRNITHIALTEATENLNLDERIFGDWGTRVGSNLTVRFNYAGKFPIVAATKRTAVSSVFISFWGKVPIVFRMGAKGTGSWWGWRGAGLTSERRNPTPDSRIVLLAPRSHKTC